MLLTRLPLQCAMPFVLMMHEYSTCESARQGCTHVHGFSILGECVRPVGLAQSFNAVLASRLARVAFMHHDKKGHDALNTMWLLTGYPEKAEAFCFTSCSPMTSSGKQLNLHHSRWSH